MFVTSLRAPRLAVALALGLFLQAAAAQNVAGMAQHFPPGSIADKDQAVRALDAVEQERKLVEGRFARREQECYPKFFATACLDKAKDERRVDLKTLRDIEVEAEAFQRRERAAERDRVLSEQRAKEAAEAPERLHRQQEGEAAAARKAQDRAQRAEQDRLKQAEAEQRAQRDEAARQEKERAVQARTNAPPRSAPATTLREEEHAERVRKAQTREAAEADKRARNVAAYEKKQREAEERQRKLAERQAKRAQEQEDKARQEADKARQKAEKEAAAAGGAK